MSFLGVFAGGGGGGGGGTIYRARKVVSSTVAAHKSQERLEKTKRYLPWLGLMLLLLLFSFHFCRWESGEDLKAFARSILVYYIRREGIL